MKRLLIVYASTEGHTRKVAQFLAGAAAELGWGATLHDAEALGIGIQPREFDKVIVAGSVHMDRHQAAIEQLVDRVGARLDNRNSALLSVSLSAAGDAEDRFRAWEYTRELLATSVWRPGHVEIVAGALRFSATDFFKRWAMKRLSKKKRVDVNPSEDYEFTDWNEVSAFLRRVLADSNVGRREESLNAR